MVKKSILHYVFLFLQKMLLHIQYLTWQYIYRRDQGYGNSARVCTISCRQKRNDELSSKYDFIFFHDSFCHPNVVMQDNYSLYNICVEEDEAIFVDCGMINVFSSKRNSFMYNAQYEHATKIIIMPLSSAKKLSKFVEIPNIPMLHVANHGRCGSTLLYKLFESIPNSLSISEPNSFTDLSEYARVKAVSQDELYSLCEVCVKMLYKHAISRKSDMLFLKCQSMDVFVTDILCDVAPHMKQIYMYREPVPFVRSYEKLRFINNWRYPNVDDLKPWAGIGDFDILNGLPLYEDSFYDNLLPFSKYALVWILSVAAFKQLLKKNYQLKAFKYEDLLKDPNGSMKKLLEYMQVKDLKTLDFQATMKEDSQAGTSYTSRNVSMEVMEKVYLKIDDAVREEADQLCQDYDVPLFWEKVVLPNSI